MIEFEVNGEQAYVDVEEREFEYPRKDWVLFSLKALMDANKIQTMPVNGITEHPGEKRVELDDDEFRERAMNLLEKAGYEPAEKLQLSNTSNADVITSELFQAHKEQIWIDDLSKAPTMWESDESVPKFVEQWVSETIELVNPVWDGQFDNVPITDRYKVKEIISDSLTQPQGWSTDSIAKRLEEEFFYLSEDQSQIIARQEVAAILNKARETAYKARPDSEQKEFDWIGPSDRKTTELCSEIKSEIDSSGGSVPLNELKSIIKEKAQEHEYGTPERASEYVPHYQCRHTLIERDIEKTEKDRVYVDNPSQAPDDVEVQQGTQGGLYYDRDQSTEPDDSPSPIDDLDMSMSEAEDEIRETIYGSDAETVIEDASDEVFADYARLSADDNVEIEGLAFIDTLEEGDTLLHPKTGQTTITEVYQDPFASHGPNAGYVRTEDDKAIMLQFNDMEDDIPDELDRINLDGTRRVTEYEPVAPEEFDEQAIDYSDTVEETTVTGPKSKRLSREQRRRFDDELDSVSKEKADEIRNLQRSAKKSSYSTDGKEREKAFLSAVGLRDELNERNGDITSPEPDEDLVQIAEVVVEQSQKAFREVYGENETVSRGVSEEAFEAMIREGINKETDTLEIETFGMTNYSTQEAVADTFAERRQTASINIDISPDDVLSWTDGIFSAMNEGEVSIKGGETELNTEDIVLPYLGGGGATLEEMLEDPTSTFLSLLSNKGLEELAVELEQQQ
jgi:hypothetical protein